MPEMNEHTEKDNILANAVDALIGDTEMNTTNIENANLSDVLATAKELHAMSQNYPGATATQQQAIEIKQIYRAELLEPKSVQPFAWLADFFTLPRPTLVSFASVAVMVLFIAGLLLTTEGGNLTATATNSGWGIPLFIGFLAASSAIAYWFSKK